ncbi:MAG: 50S ribosomal protein L25 [Limisphaerales bacterium]|jgi:large subunit ribosomal protein L25
MKAVTLNAFERTLTRRAGAKQLRAAGRVPAVIYGRSKAPANLEINERELESLVKHSASETILVDLSVQGVDSKTANELALVQAVQHHPLTGRVLHVDFHQVAADEKVQVTLPIESQGSAAGVKNGGVLEHVLFKVKVRALPKDLPEVLTVDVSSLDVGQIIHLGEIALPAGVEVVGDASIPVFAVAAPLTESAEATAESGAPTQPEMIKEKKDEGKK